MRLTIERVRELLAVDGTRRLFGGVLLDAALVRDVAADLLDAHAALATERERAEAAKAECARLTECLKRGNANMEEMEREMYLQLDGVEDAYRARADAAEAECARLRAAIKTQAAAVRSLDGARAAIDANNQRVLRSLAGEERATVLAQGDEARAECALWNARATAMEADRDTARAEADALRAIIEGRADAPTDAEIAAHAGEWRCVGAGAAYAEISGPVAAGLRDVARGVTLRWWPLDANGRPCAWPTLVSLR